MILTKSGDENRVQTRRFGAGGREEELAMGDRSLIIGHLAGERRENLLNPVPHFQ